MEDTFLLTVRLFEESRPLTPVPSSITSRADRCDAMVWKQRRRAAGVATAGAAGQRQPRQGDAGLTAPGRPTGPCLSLQVTSRGSGTQVCRAWGCVKEFHSPEVPVKPEEGPGRERRQERPVKGARLLPVAPHSWFTAPLS